MKGQTAYVSGALFPTSDTVPDWCNERWHLSLPRGHTWLPTSDQLLEMAMIALLDAEDSTTGVKEVDGNHNPEQLPMRRALWYDLRESADDPWTTLRKWRDGEDAERRTDIDDPVGWTRITTDGRSEQAIAIKRAAARMLLDDLMQVILLGHDSTDDAAAGSPEEDFASFVAELRAETLRQGGTA